jgi:hypothetical protein
LRIRPFGGGGDIRNLLHSILGITMVKGSASCDKEANDSGGFHEAPH